MITLKALWLQEPTQTLKERKLGYRNSEIKGSTAKTNGKKKTQETKPHRKGTKPSQGMTNSHNKGQHPPSPTHPHTHTHKGGKLPQKERERA